MFQFASDHLEKNKFLHSLYIEWHPSLSSCSNLVEPGKRFQTRKRSAKPKVSKHALAASVWSGTALPSKLLVASPRENFRGNLMDESFFLANHGQPKTAIILDLVSVSSPKKVISAPCLRAARNTPSKLAHPVGHPVGFGLAGLAPADLAEAGDRRQKRHKD